MRSRGNLLSLLTWAVVAAFWLVTTRNYHATWSRAFVVTGSLMAAYATAVYVNHQVLVPRYWGGRFGTYGLLLATTMSVFTAVALTVNLLEDIRKSGLDLNAFLVCKHYAIDFFGMAVHVVGAACVVWIYRRRQAVRALDRCGILESPHQDGEIPCHDHETQLMTKQTEAKPQTPKKPRAKKYVRKWLLRTAGVMLLFLGVPVTFLLNPSLLYAHHTVHNQFVIYHNSPLSPAFAQRLDNVTRHLEASELADPALRIDVCLNDGSKYPALVRRLFGPAFAQSFYNKFVLRGEVDWQANVVSEPDCRWNLEQLLTHEATHCLQLNRFGIWNWRPLNTQPVWKEEGYPEYVARRNPDQTDPAANIRRLLETEEQGDHDGWVTFADGTVVDIPYYRYWLLTQYCLDIKHMTYVQLLADTSSKAEIETEMMEWYREHAAKE
jgi:hypothetical protein